MKTIFKSPKSPLCFLILLGMFVIPIQTNAQTTKEKCFETVNSYYKALNDYVKYSDLTADIAVLFYIPDSINKNIVHIDLRLFEGKPIADKTSLESYLDAIKKIKNTGKGLRFETSIIKKKYSEETRYVPELQRRGVVSELQVDKMVFCGNDERHIIDKITLVDGKIAKIQSKEYVKPKSRFAEMVDEIFEPADFESAVNVWGSTNLCFGITGQFEDLSPSDAIHLGYGLEGNGIASRINDDYDWMPMLLGQISWDCTYFSLGANIGIGGYIHDQKEETIYGESVITSEDMSSFSLLASPYIGITIPFDETALRLMVGYNWYFIAGSEWNGLRFGLGLSFD